MYTACLVQLSPSPVQAWYCQVLLLLIQLSRLLIVHVLVQVLSVASEMFTSGSPMRHAGQAQPFLKVQMMQMAYMSVQSSKQPGNNRLFTHSVCFSKHIHPPIKSYFAALNGYSLNEDFCTRHISKMQISLFEVRKATLMMCKSTSSGAAVFGL